MKTSIDQRELGSVPCARCGQPCRIAPHSNPDARLLRHATQPVPDGLCANCAVTSFIRSIETLMYGIEKNGIATLRDRRIQVGFEEVMQAGRADASPGEIDWSRVITNWDLPLPKARRQ